MPFLSTAPTSIGALLRGRRRSVEAVASSRPDVTSPEGLPVILLGAGITALGAQRTLSRKGFKTFLAGGSAEVNQRSRWYREIPGLEPGDGDALPSWLESLELDGAVLIPCSDSWARAVATLEPSLRERFPSSISPAATLDVLVDKAGFCHVVEELDVPHPWTRVVDGPAELDGLDVTALHSIFLKPRDSQSFMQDFGVKAFRVDSAEDARHRLESIMERGHGLVVQEYLPGPPSYHYFIDGFIDRTGGVRAVFARQRLRMYPPFFGNSTFMRSIPVAEVQPAVDSLTRLLGALDYRGLFSAEFKLDPRDGRYKILEVNARAWWYVEFAARCGVDVLEMSYRDALGLAVPEVQSYQVGRTLSYPYSDFYACLDERREGRLGLLAWGGSWLRSMQPVFHPLDPWPALAGAGQVLGSWLARRLAALVRR